MTNEAIEAAARAMGRVISFDGDPISHYATADELTAMARAAAPALMEEGARLALEAAAGYLDGRGGIVIPGTVAFASLVSGNNQPCMSGNPADRLHPPQRRKFDDATAALAEAIRALDPAAIVKGAGHDL